MQPSLGTDISPLGSHTGHVLGYSGHPFEGVLARGGWDADGGSPTLLRWWAGWGKGAWLRGSTCGVDFRFCALAWSRGGITEIAE